MAKYVKRPLETVRSVKILLNGREITEAEQATVDRTNPTVTRIVEDSLTLHFERLERQREQQDTGRRRAAS